MSTNNNPYYKYSKTALNILTSNWFTPDTPGNWVPNDYWRTPTICLILIEAMQLYDTNDYLNTLVNAYNAGNPDTTDCAYYDDLSVWGRMYTKGYRLLNAQGKVQDAANFLNEAKTVSNQLKSAADSVCGGGIWWKRDTGDPNNFKAANSTIGWAETAIDLYNITQDASYLNDAKTAMDWVMAKGLIASNGAVWGGMGHQTDCSIANDNPPVIALQGNPLAPLWALYAATKNQSYLTAAQNCVAWAMANKTFSGTQIFQTKEDVEWKNQSLNWQEGNSGPCLFKGIFSRYLAELAINMFKSGDADLVIRAKKYDTMLKANADMVVKNYPSYIFSMDWNSPNPGYTPTPNDQLNASLQYSGVSVLLSAAKTASIIS
ncbi:hypothetical protein GTQ34_14315 [Muricauda sp. JGD-17]|uniref:Glycosyl hydrolase family 76 n=1 Tax=Flagellimonas ochracea TaxID=2696472 RepID=A0A964TFR8_9FLAO|nr:glycoside hydrolase family 76 protein [Allomuricauda ochracea]NAY93091.1 hypothetical protein [Allomuricauda ochracea]